VTQRIVAAVATEVTLLWLLATVCACTRELLTGPTHLATDCGVNQGKVLEASSTMAVETNADTGHLVGRDL
jgi:hypothetical protein